MVIVKINGGLGNQMFEYMFYKYLQTKFEDVKIDKSIYSRMEQHNGYELDRIFGLTPPVATENEIRKLKADSWKIHRKVQYKIFGFPNTVINQETDCSYLSDLKDNKYYAGYWINRKYFPQHRSEVKSIFNFKNEMSERNKEAVTEIKNSNSISIHIRRGDYVGNRTYEGICNDKYYKCAIGIMENKIDKPRYYIFSDEPEWVKNNFKLDFMTVVDWNKGEDSYWDMYLMSCCKHNIMANSTFSWWGAYLNSNEDKIVIGPRYWFVNEKDNNSEEMADALMPENWYRI
jgi:hypothetical protein